jgi:heavy metal efflux system protein
MVHQLIHWALDNKLIVLILMFGLVGFGGYAFVHVNVEAYPDPAPAIVEVIAKFPGASAEEVERQVTIPLEVVIAGIPGLKYTRTKSLFGLSHLRNQFEYGVDFLKARQEIINRLQFVDGLPPGVVPTLSPQSPTGEILRYTLTNPKTDKGKDVYTLNDLKSMQDTVLERQFRRVPRIIDIVSSGGTVKRYEIHPDPERLMRYEVTLDQLAQAIKDSNANVGGDYMVQGDNLLNIRATGLIGGGLDPTRDLSVLQATSPEAAAAYLRAEELRRIERIRSTVIKAVNHQPIRVEDVVDGGPNRDPDEIGMRGVVVGNVPRLGRASISYRQKDDQGKVVLNSDGEPIWIDEEEKIQGIVLMRKGESSLPALAGLEKKIHELNNHSGRLLPGVTIEPYYDRTDLINVTTETVHENLIVGMVLVTVILLMFLGNVRSALIVAINIPLALLFAFVVLFVRGKSANLLSIGAVDFGIIVDSSVIMVENIYRHLSAGDNKELPFKDRILIASREVEGGLFYTTAIMVCAFLPLFTMQGPEGQIFGPMADTYAFALGGALLMSLTIAPVLCALFFTKLKPVEDNMLVKMIKKGYLKNLDTYLRNRTIFLGLTLFAVVSTFSYIPYMGREFMPELEEGNLWIRGTFPISIAQDAAAEKIRAARKIMQKYPEIEVVVSMNGRPDDGTDPTGFYNSEFFVPLKPHNVWPAVKSTTGIMSYFYPTRSRTKEELISEMNRELEDALFGVDWNFSQNIRDNVMESLSGVKGDNSVKILGPDLDELERLAGQLKQRLDSIQGIENVGIFRVKGQPNLEIPVDPAKCSRWGLSVADVEDVLETAVGGKPFSTMVEGEKRFDITLRWPAALRTSEDAILNIPVDISNNNITDDNTNDDTNPNDNSMNNNAALNRRGFNEPQPSLSGNPVSSQSNYIVRQPRRRLRDFVTPVNSRGIPDPNEGFIRSGASTIYREQGNRLIAVKFSVRGRDLASAVAEAQLKTEDLFTAPYTTEWSGEFQEMKEAEARLMVIVPLSLVLIFILLYLAFHSFLDALVVLSNVLALSIGGIWALFLTGSNFSISAAVGFISLFGVAIMDGLLMISYFNHLRHQGMPLKEAIMLGAEKRVRPVTMTALTAIFGLLPAAMSTRIGAQTQRPLAIVVVGGMIATLFLTRYLMPILYSYYGHREPNEASSSLVH